MVDYKYKLYENYINGSLRPKLDIEDDYFLFNKIYNDCFDYKTELYNILKDIYYSENKMRSLEDLFGEPNKTFDYIEKIEKIKYLKEKNRYILPCYSNIPLTNKQLFLVIEEYLKSLKKFLKYYNMKLNINTRKADLKFEFTLFESYMKNRG